MGSISLSSMGMEERVGERRFVSDPSNRQQTSVSMEILTNPSPCPSPRRSGERE